LQSGFSIFYWRKAGFQSSYIKPTAAREYREGTSLVDMLREDLIADGSLLCLIVKRSTISARKIRHREDNGVDSEQEEEHARELTDLLFSLDETLQHEPAALFAEEKKAANRVRIRN